MSDSTPVWFITGSNTGFGDAIARAALASGARVVATARRPETIQLSDDNILALHLDVTDPESIEAAVAAAIERFGRIDVLVNNAGHGLVGALEELSEKQIDDVLAVNLRGVMRVTRAVLPTMRAQRSGTIVQLSSVGGVIANPGHAIYATSKFALEGMSEALAGEVGPLGIRVLIVEPGPFRTEFAGRSMSFADPIEDYATTPAGALRARFRDQNGVQPNDPERAAALILEAVADPNTPLRIPLGPEAIDRIRTKLTGQLADLEAWAPRGADTRF
ncbi:SDR family NAD(P)-dependent oxidoreductase [Calidifontibacter sp. DB0510]|uniref:SDR family NAD(P)-dependent oxidoreductase n=1 Tax=Metallococcus carri TaxID=1656884 RepID=A0A967B7J5_9MICO|nr:SDR family NAD(P)-dependent oxidoreductase [Metallococcus carri]NHN57027.1 SDR family NAD(P)-dependent oxidoreductase [Metallococcus carri]NOP39104.1 SDR family NAD(P)-dependent oxidoreductase [Calidifontibacter sp. DB2511S]